MWSLRAAKGHFVYLKAVNCHHRLCGSTSPVLTATHHSYGSLRLSDFFWLTPGGQTPNDLHAKWLKRRGFTQG